MNESKKGLELFMAYRKALRNYRRLNKGPRHNNDELWEMVAKAQEELLDYIIKLESK